MVNKCIFIGNVGQDPEIRTTTSGKEVANFSLAVRAGKDGTEWVNVVAWEKMAEVCEKYINKGNKVYVEGELRTRSWEDNDGNKKYRTECIARLVLNLDKRGERSSSADENPF